jgi:DNA-binding LacI/PurR family transcriptional regulator
MPEMTLAQVAKRANVAINTASKVFNNDQTVRSYLRERVLQAAQELNYQPSMMARGLRKKQTNIVTVGIKQLDNPYFGALSQAIIAALTAKGYVGIVCIDHDHIKDINVASCACGSIVSQALSEDLGNIQQAGPIITINNLNPRPDLASDVQFDFSSAYQVVIDDLKQQGVKRVMFGCPFEELHWEVDYRQKFALVHEAFRQSPTSEPIVRTSPEQVMEHLQQDPTIDAVFCVNDPFAVDLFILLQTHSPELARRIKVVGCDGNRKLWGNWSIKLDVNEIAQLAVNHLHNRLQGEDHDKPILYRPVACKA